MTLKHYLKERHISIRSLSVETGIPYSTLNDLCNGKTDVDRTSFGVIKTICGALQMTLDEFVALTDRDETFPQPDHGGRIIVRNKCYYLDTNDGAEPERLCKVTPLNTRFVIDMAERRILGQERKERVEALWNTITT